jgi:Ca2+-binding EF-hand superfamily protein
VRHYLKNLAKICLAKFNQVSHIFRYFDHKGKGHVTFSDFSLRIEEIGLRYPRDMVDSMFAYLDSDNDTLLKYIDFVNLCQETHSTLPNIDDVISKASLRSH